MEPEECLEIVYRFFGPPAAENLRRMIPWHSDNRSSKAVRFGAVGGEWWVELSLDCAGGARGDFSLAG